MGIKWNMRKANAIIDERKKSEDDRKRQVFTGAYIIPNAGSTDPKSEVICRALDWVYDNRKDLAKRLRNEPSMEKAVNILQNVFTIGPFIAYEIACDLRFTKLLADACDINSWANPGPGAKRGIHRILSGKKKWEGDRPNYVKVMRELLVLARTQKDTISDEIKRCEWPFEMREIEHSLCEYDKYCRVKYKEGRPRSRYAPYSWDSDVEGEEPIKLSKSERKARKKMEELRRQGQQELDL
jgi:hypothetical protein